MPPVEIFALVIVFAAMFVVVIVPAAILLPVIVRSAILTAVTAPSIRLLVFTEFAVIIAAVMLLFATVAVAAICAHDAVFVLYCFSSGGTTLVSSHKYRFNFVSVTSGVVAE
ncbi:MAG: hypothetical protein EBS84_20175 [Proteobacteria bacterium]|nr:hypothetical protein [Pseudomonadota bacterium]